MGVPNALTKRWANKLRQKPIRLFATVAIPNEEAIWPQ